jgi:hypothetical protein
MRKNPRRILSPQRLPFRHPGNGSTNLTNGLIYCNTGEKKPQGCEDSALHRWSKYRPARDQSPASMQDKIRVLGVLRYILLYRGANDVDLEVMLSGETESCFCQRGCEAHMAQAFRNLRMVQGQNISGQRVIEVGEVAVALDFEATRRDLLRFSRIAVEDLPHKR